MVQDIGYNVINEVLETWETVRRLKNYSQVAGVMLFQRLFDKCPEAKILFGFPLNCDPYSDDVCKSKRFITHASYLIEMIDTALNMLGPDIELLTEILYDLGKKHVKYGVKPTMFPIMGTCLIEVLKEVLKDDFTPSIEKSWLITYKSLSDDMIKAQKSIMK